MPANTPFSSVEDGRPLLASFSRSALRHNARLARRLAPAGGQVLGVIKADAYGHGLLATANSLRGEVDGFAVLELEAARQLRQQGFDEPILMLESFHSSAELEEFVTLSLSTVIHRLDQIDTLAQARLSSP
ncbi:MAG: alanine racemase, partial [Fluviibacter sp.]